MKDIRAEIEKILDDNISYGYEFQKSDYAVSNKEEDEYYQRGREEVKETIDQILSLIEGIIPPTKLPHGLEWEDGWNECRADILSKLGDKVDDKKLRVKEDE